MKVFLPLYALALLYLTPHLSLWLDEILTLIGAIEPNTRALLDYIKTVPGGSPLAFLAPRWTIQALGYSVLAGRLSSVIASVAACPAIYLLAQRMKIRTPLLAVVVFALWPLQFRYAMEARPYALALALTIWSTEIFLSLRDRPSRMWLYATLTVLAALTQPYALFVTAAHLTWAIFYDRRPLRAPLVSIALAALVLVPWYAHFQPDWTAVVADQQLASFDPRSALVALHEISGSGYTGTAILLIGVALGLRRATEPRHFWLISALALPLAVFAANTAMHYFFATRQLIYILPSLTLLFTLGTHSTGKYGNLLLVAFLAASLYEDIQWFRKPREDWQAAADAIQREVSRGACVQFLGDSTPVFLFFHPDLSTHTCTAASDRIALAITPYSESRDYPAAAASLTTRALMKQSEQSFDGPRVEVFSK